MLQEKAKEAVRERAAQMKKRKGKSRMMKGKREVAESAPRAVLAAVIVIDEPHLLVEQLPEPAAVELREGDESRGIKSLDCLRKTTIRRDWKRQRNARNANKELLTRQTTTSSAPVLLRHRRVPPGGCP